MGENKPTVIVCDDLMFNRIVLGKMFRKLGFVVLEAEDGAQAVELFNRQHTGVGLIVMDLVMPVLDGYGATQALRRVEATLQLGRCPVVACTAEVNSNSTDPAHIAHTQSVITACLACGMDHVVGKPVTLQTVQHLVGRFVPGFQLEAVGSHIQPGTSSGRFALDVEQTDKLNDRARALLSSCSAQNVEAANARAPRRASFDDHRRMPRTTLQSLTSHCTISYLPKLLKAKLGGRVQPNWAPNALVVAPQPSVQ